MGLRSVFPIPLVLISLSISQYLFVCCLGSILLPLSQFLLIFVVLKEMVDHFVMLPVIDVVFI